MKMNCKAKSELNQMISSIRTENYTWERIIQRGRIALRKIASLQLSILATEDLWNLTNNVRKLRILEKKIGALFQRLKNLYMSMDQYLEDLSKIRDNTCRMLSRTRLWENDDELALHKIARNLNISQLSAFLEFLYQRYDAEWEVKDMVIREIQGSSGSSDTAFLVTTWDNCPHAGGKEFIEMFNIFYGMVDRRYL